MSNQLSFPERIVIEKMIHQDYTFASIARNLERSAFTVAREVLHYRCFTNRLPISGDLLNAIFWTKHPMSVATAKCKKAVKKSKPITLHTKLMLLITNQLRRLIPVLEKLLLNFAKLRRLLSL